MLSGMEALRTYLEKHGRTQSDLAQELGVTQPTVSDWVNGECAPSLPNLIALSRVTGLSLDQLVGTKAA